MIMSGKSYFDVDRTSNYSYNFNGNKGYIVKHYDPNSDQGEIGAYQGSQDNYLSWNVVPLEKLHKKINKKAQKRKEKRKKMREKRKEKHKFMKDMMIGMMTKVIEIIPMAKMMTILLFALLLFAKKAFLVSIASLMIVAFDYYKKNRSASPTTTPASHYPNRGEEERFWWQEVLMKNKQATDRNTNPSSSSHDSWSLPPLHFLIPYLEKIRQDESLDNKSTKLIETPRTIDDLLPLESRTFNKDIRRNHQGRYAALYMTDNNMGDAIKEVDDQVALAHKQKVPACQMGNNEEEKSNENVVNTKPSEKNLSSQRLWGTSTYFAVPQASTFT